MQVTINGRRLLRLFSSSLPVSGNTSSVTALLVAESGFDMYSVNCPCCCCCCCCRSRSIMAEQIRCQALGWSVVSSMMPLSLTIILCTSTCVRDKVVLRRETNKSGMLTFHIGECALGTPEEGRIQEPWISGFSCKCKASGAASTS